MISLREAYEIVVRQTPRLQAAPVPLLAAPGRVLAEQVNADINMPPFPRSSMDGYAVRTADLAQIPSELHVIATIAAGSFPDFTLQPGQAAKIMTGAPVPPGADAVQMIEKTRAVGHGHAVEILEPVSAGANITPKGSEAQEGEIVLPAGSFISPAVIGLLAAVGKSDVAVYRAPVTGILTTGDELIEITARPARAQIRNSNAYALCALVQQAGGIPRLLGTARDQISDIREKIAPGLQHDLLLLTGGVSMGDLDLVEEAFAQSGFEIFFDKVAVKPGKPVVFARSGATLIFGLPGNPVSANTIFELLVRPAMRKMMGFTSHSNPVVRARLTERFVNRSGREFYAPARVVYENGVFFVHPLKSKGSGDVVSYAASNAYLICPITRTEFKADEEVEVMLRTEFFYH
ncbi:MAG: molybdopterin molybdotransferase MoeA [bacterium]